MQDKKNYLLVGLNSKSGKAVADFATKKFFIHCLIRGAPQVALNSIFFKIVEGDAAKAQDLEAALEGKDGVISLYGVPEDAQPNAICEYTEQLLTAMKNKGVKRLICVGSSGNLQKDGKPYHQSPDYPANMKVRAEDHCKAMKIIQESGLVYTIPSEADAQAQTLQDWFNDPIGSRSLGKFLVDVADQGLFQNKVIGVKSQL